MSLGGISDYLKANNISIPEDYSPYQATMSQMGNYGGMDGTSYQQGMGNIYGGGSAATGGGYNSDLYKRVTAPVAPAGAGTDYLTRGGGGSRGYDSASAGGFSGVPFTYDSNSYTGGFLPSILGQQLPAPVVDTTGYNSAAEAESAQLQALANQYGMYNNPDASYGGGRGSDGGGSDGGGVATGGSGGDASGGGDRGTRGGFAKGGYVSMQHLQGPNPMGPDQGYAALKSKEYVIKDSAVKKYGIELMDAINSGKISKGKLRGLLEM